ncbi:ABC transporter substrate-binding protein, partial [Escherichia coli]|uniref:ABC transporter substrate-binding protein n=1 Tax=Escherichia coli TaxID=562 RepID=UPI0021670BFF
MTNITKRSLVAAGVLAALMAGNVALAADVPAGVTLAEKQTLVRNNGSEVQSLDPHKIEGVPESNISRDLFEGLLVSDLDGHPAPGVAESWDNKDAKVWTFHLRKDAKWSDGSPTYWNNAKTVINQVTYLPIASEVTDVNRYRSGEIDMTNNMPIELFQKLKKEIPDEVHVDPYLCTYYYEINNQKPP